MAPAAPPQKYGQGFFSFFSPAERKFTAAASVFSSALFLTALGLVRRLARYVRNEVLGYTHMPTEFVVE